MRNKNIYRFLLLFIVSESLSLAYDFDLKSFGTLSFVKNSSPYTYRKDILQKDGSKENHVSIKTDSLFGLQGSFSLNDNISFLAQGLIKKDYKDDTVASLDWAYAKYDTNQNISFRAGRLRTPYYHNSENLNIGYSNLMIRESVEVYGQVPFSSFNGAVLEYKDNFNNYFYSVVVGGGRENLKVPIHSLNELVKVDVKNLYTANATFGNDIIEFRATYLQAKISAKNATINNLFDTLKNNNLGALASRYEYNNKLSKYMGFGVFLNYENFIFNSEYGKRESESFFSNTHGYYATIGYHIDKTVPFITYASSKMDEKTYNANTISDDLNTILRAQNTAQSTTTIGVRECLSKNIDLKFQYEHIRPKGPYGSYYLGTTPNPQHMNVFSFALDFIF